MATINAADTLGSGSEKYQQDLFGRSPLSGTLGFWNISTDITVTVFSTSVPSAPAITHTYSNLSVNQAIALPVPGFLSRPQVTTECRIIVTDSINAVICLIRYPVPVIKTGTFYSKITE
ncbi:hypothetical protein ACI1AR_003027 [Cronobacter dublinensis]